MVLEVPSDFNGNWLGTLGRITLRSLGACCLLGQTTLTHMDAVIGYKNMRFSLWSVVSLQLSGLFLLRPC